MLHIESFDPRGDGGELETFLKEKAPYWRKRGFQVKAYVTQYGLPEATRSWRIRTSYFCPATWIGQGNCM